MAIRYPISPSSWTLSHRLRISSQFSPVRFSSVVFARAKRKKVLPLALWIPNLTDNLVVRVRCASSEHCGQGLVYCCEIDPEVTASVIRGHKSQVTPPGIFY